MKTLSKTRSQTTLIAIIAIAILFIGGAVALLRFTIQKEMSITLSEQPNPYALIVYELDRSTPASYDLLFEKTQFPNETWTTGCVYFESDPQMELYTYATDDYYLERVDPASSSNVYATYNLTIPTELENCTFTLEGTPDGITWTDWTTQTLDFNGIDYYKFHCFITGIENPTAVSGLSIEILFIADDGS